MEIILLGYGKMGQAIERIALQRGHTITARIDVANQHELESAQGDVVIEFSHPDAALNNIRRALTRNLPVICGTTGWLESRESVEALCQSLNGTFFYASNYSLGVNLFFELNSRLAAMMAQFSSYKVSMEEIHHTEKKDAPSGTAITLAEGICTNHPGYTGWSMEPKSGKIEIQSKRIGTTPGTHLVTYTSEVDAIEIKHTAFTRESFALGAVMVAEWIKDKKGILSMQDFLPSMPY